MYSAAEAGAEPADETMESSSSPSTTMRLHTCAEVRDEMFGDGELHGRNYRLAEAGKTAMTDGARYGHISTYPRVRS